jgi:hypothetical protein
MFACFRVACLAPPQDFYRLTSGASIGGGGVAEHARRTLIDTLTATASGALRLALEDAAFRLAGSPHSAHETGVPAVAVGLARRRHAKQRGNGPGKASWYTGASEPDDRRQAGAAANEIAPRPAAGEIADQLVEGRLRH